MKYFFILMFMFTLPCHISNATEYKVPDEPDHILSPGDIATSKWEDICNKKLSKTRNVSASKKLKVYKEYGITKNSAWCNNVDSKNQVSGCEIDHILPLENGGSNDIKNLWPQGYSGIWNAHQKDLLENRVHKLICDHPISEEQIKIYQHRLSDDWISFYKEQFNVD